MDRDQIMARLDEVKGILHERYRVAALSLFGSLARDSSSPNGDVDLVVDFEGKADFDTYMDLKFYLEDLLARRVDLVTRKAIRAELREEILGEMIRVA